MPELQIKTHWVDKFDQEHEIIKMKESYIINCLLMVHRMSKWRRTEQKARFSTYKEPLLDELKKRSELAYVLYRW